MGNYIKIINAKEVSSKLETTYKKHLAINEKQFTNEFNGLMLFEDVFVLEDNNEFEFKTGVLDRNFYTKEFMQDVQAILLHNTMTAKLDAEMEGKIPQINYFDITSCNGIYLAKVPNRIKVGDIFNVYCFESTKLGCEWLGNLEDSLVTLAISEQFAEFKQDVYIEENGFLVPKIWGTNAKKQEVKLHDKLLCGSGNDTWFTHVMYDAETKKWHREDDYMNGEVVGNYLDYEGRTDLEIQAIDEVRVYSDSIVMFLDSPIAHNHLFAVRGKVCDFYECNKFVMIYVKPNYKKLNLETDLPYLARLSKNFEEFCTYWQNELDKLKRLGENVFYKFHNDCNAIVDLMNNTDKKHFFNFHTN